MFHRYAQSAKGFSGLSGGSFPAKQYLAGYSGLRRARFPRQTNFGGEFRAPHAEENPPTVFEAAEKVA